MNPSILDQWIKILRDLTIVLVGAFMLVYETVFVPIPNYLLVGAGLTLLGVPPALRLDQLRRNRNIQESEDNEKWSHLP